VCWGFGVVESDLEDIYWTYARREIETKLQLKLGEQSAVLMCHHASLVLTVNALFSDKKAEGPQSAMAGAKNLGEGHTSVEDAVAAINRALSF